ncbi:Relaxase/Mobilisation nuclease domain [[Clostridium] symbiosum]|nr:Relaxase/Mobilisation nuclease domain [[Clostridium] symbiosum]
MAVTKTHPIKSTLKAAIDYICNPDKTDGKMLVSSFGCTAETADIEFAWTRRHAIDKGTNLGLTSSRRLSLGRSRRRKPTGSAWSWRGRSWAESMSLSSPPT